MFAKLVVGGTIMLPESQKRAYTDFYDSARYNETLGEKTTVLIHLAAAMAVSAGKVRAQFREARRGRKSPRPDENSCTC